MTGIKFSSVSTRFHATVKIKISEFFLFFTQPALLLRVRQEPLLLPALSLAAGIVAGHFYYFRLADLVTPAGLCAAVLAVAFLCGCRAGVRLAAACLLIIVSGIGVQVAHRQARTPQLNVADGEAALLDGCVVDPPALSPGREQFTAELSPNARIRVSISLKDSEKPEIGYGQRVELPAKIRRPRNFWNPGAFDYAGYLAAQHIYWTGSVADLDSVHTLPGSCGSRLLASLFRLRAWASDRLAAAYPDDPQTLALLSATLLGETASLERRWTTEFRATGTYHALVISGLHVWVVATALLFLLRICQLPKLQALTVAALVCWGYAVLTGGNAPVIRAAAGYSLFLLASFFFRRTRILNLLAIVALLYLSLDPDALFDPAFQLSFLSAAAIALFAVPLIDRYLEPVRHATFRLNQTRYDPLVPPSAATWRVEFRLLSQTLQVWTGMKVSCAVRLVTCAVTAACFAAEAVVISTCVQFALALPMIAYFHQLSATGISANIVIVPLLTVVIPAGFLLILTGWHGLAVVCAALMHAAEWLAQWHLRFEPPWRIADVPFAAALVFSLTLIILALCARRLPRVVPVAACVAIAAFGVVVSQPWRPVVQPHELEVTAIDVGQGDSILVVFPNGQTMLVDAGGIPGMERMRHKPKMDFGEDVVSPYLWSRYFHRLDYAVLTHGHSDHMAGMGAVLDNFRPAALLTGAEPETHEWRDLSARAARDGVAVRKLHRGAPDMWLGDARIRVLAPAPDYQPEEAAKNDDSLVLEITYGKQRVLLTGDAERQEEEDLVANAALQPVTLLKVGHHGSRTSSSEDFLNQIQPKLAFISDGYLNSFHHPHPVVLKRLADHHVATLRTDEDGLLTFRTDGQHATVASFR